VLVERLRTAGDRRESMLLVRGLGPRGRDVVHDHVQVRTPFDEMRHEIAARTADVEHVCAARREIIDDARQVPEYAASREAKVLLAIVHDLELPADETRIDARVGPNEPAPAALEEMNQRAEMDVLAPGFSLRTPAAVRASPHAFRLHLLESVAFGVAQPARVAIESDVALEYRPIIPLLVRHRSPSSVAWLSRRAVRQGRRRRERPTAEAVISRSGRIAARVVPKCSLGVERSTPLASGSCTHAQRIVIEHEGHCQTEQWPSHDRRAEPARRRTMAKSGRESANARRPSAA